MIDANTVKRFLQDWKDAGAISISLIALGISLWNAVRDHRRYRQQQPQFKFHVWIVPFMDVEAFGRAHAAIFEDERRAAMREAGRFSWALHVRATNEGSQPVTLEYCSCEVSSVAAQNPALYGSEHSMVAVDESKCKLSTGDMHEWVVKLKMFPYRILRVYIFNSVGDVWCVDDRKVLDVHRTTVKKWPYSDARLALLPVPISLLFLRHYRRHFRPTAVEPSKKKEGR